MLSTVIMNFTVESVVSLCYEYSVRETETERMLETLNITVISISVHPSFCYRLMLQFLFNLNLENVIHPMKSDTGMNFASNLSLEEPEVQSATVQMLGNET